MDTAAMSLQTLLLALVVASAALAAWLVARFPRFVPRTGWGIAAAAAGAAVVGATLTPAIALVGGRVGSLAAIMLVALPACTYLFLLVLWTMLFVKRTIDPFLP